MRPASVIHFNAADFGDNVACLGGQMSKTLKAVNDIDLGLCWYVADVRTTGSRIVAWEDQSPSRVDDTQAMLELVAKIDQFESGVFAGVPCRIKNPRFRDRTLWTEDEEYAEMGDAMIEIRAFDTSYIQFASIDRDLARKICRVVLGKDCA